ncbi:MULTISPECIES: hypothetical protein [Bacillus]|uniref:hypothetical protein n=1 Tax=Bacillus TaxID=1386 RepID=UPI0009521983|nr:MULTISPECIES: hypothetical protein [Bacillus]MCY8126233.1 hypothetical protein [Bacillus spizizenii]OLQ53698.1 hypothetical protein BHT94_19855 [Bacillus licheniformis]MBU8803374.1 hypothetical protein [Bacillus subtilis]MCV0023414.1 hypothetical protein [Bacillus sp. XT-2]MCV0025701.1 hypothetical protein [Bacillus sp. XT-2]
MREKIEELLNEFKENGSVLVNTSVQNLEDSFEKALISITEHYDKDYKNGYVRFFKSNRSFFL